MSFHSAKLLLLGIFTATTLLAAGRASAGYTVALNGSTLEVTGDNKSDRLALRMGAAATLLEVDVKNDGTPDFTVDRALFTGISVSAGGGKDVVLIDETTGAFTGEAVVIDGGAGNDTITGSSGPDVIIAGDGDDIVTARQGNDVILLGAGDDVTTWAPGEGSDTVEGQTGEDRIAFNTSAASEIFVLSANGGRTLFTRNVAAIVFDVDDVEQLDLASLGGADLLTVNDLSGTDLVRVNVDLAGALGGETGDAQADSVEIHGAAGPEIVSVGVTKGVLEVTGLAATVRIAHGETALDLVSYLALGSDDVHVLGTKQPDSIALAPSPVVGALRTAVGGFPVPIDVSGDVDLTVFGLGGTDTIGCSGSIAALAIPVALDGGSGNDDITGSNGVDVILGGSGKDVVRGLQGNDLILLGSGSDVAIWNPGDGSDTVEGEQGTDTLEFNGSNAAEIIDVAPVGSRVALTRNVAAISMDLNAVEQIGVALFGGADQVVVNDLTSSGVKRVTLDLEAVLGGGAGDAQTDEVTVYGTSAADKMRVTSSSRGVSVSRKGGPVLIEHPEPTDGLVLNGLAGADQITAASNVSSAIALSIVP